MKKLIALAVAAAAAPAMAAVSLSGGVEVSYSSVDAKVADVSVAGGTASSAAAASKTVGTEQVTLGVSASSELDNGMTISTSYTIHGAGDVITNDAGEGSITVAGSFGSLSVGDVGGPLDGRDGNAAATAENDLSAAFGADMSVVYTLPSMAEGLNVSVGVSAENAGDAGVAEDAVGVAFDYTVGGFKIYAGMEDSKTSVAAVEAVSAVAGIYSSTGALGIASTAVASMGSAGLSSYTEVVAPVAEVTAADAYKKDNEVVGYGVSYTVNGFTVAANYAEKEVNDAGTVTKHEKEAFGASYTTGALTLAFNTLEDTTDNVVKEEQDTASVAYNLGGGATVYAASTTREKAKNDETTVGIKFSF